jgi:hypothetical protein
MLTCRFCYETSPFHLAWYRFTGHFWMRRIYTIATDILRRIPFDRRVLFMKEVTAKTDNDGTTAGGRHHTSKQLHIADVTAITWPVTAMLKTARVADDDILSDHSTSYECHGKQTDRNVDGLELQFMPKSVEQGRS